MLLYYVKLLLKVLEIFFTETGVEKITYDQWLTLASESQGISGLLNFFF